MAIVYFVRDGTGESATDAGREISLSSITKAFGNCKLIWSINAPSFGGHSPANAVSDFRYVVIHVEAGETADQFTKDGYWFLDGVSPAKFKQAVSSS